VAILKICNLSGILSPNRGAQALPNGRIVMAKFDLEAYDTVETRLARFWEAHPNGRVLTKLEFHDERRFIVYSEIYFDREDHTPVATGYAEEIVGASPVNRTSALENCETSSIGRSLANCGFASLGKRPSKEEMEKVQRYSEEPRKPIKEAEPARVYTEEEIAKATKALVLFGEAPTVEALKLVWEEYKDLGECKIDGVSLLSAVNIKKKQLES
jgi:hypothetical protein